MSSTFSIGNVLSTGFRIWIKNFIPFMLITALIYAPVAIWEITAVQGELTMERLVSLDRTLKLAGGLAILLNLLLSAALTYGVVMELQGHHASIGACIATGLSRFLAVLGVGVLTTLCVGGALMLLIIPGLIVFCMLYVATQCAVLERPGLLGALKRSRELTSGHRWEIFGLLVILGVINFALQKLVESVTLSSIDDVPRYVYVMLGQQMAVGSLGAVMASVAYYFLRAEKEGTSADELAAVFG
jgi:hypothetical protein